MWRSVGSPGHPRRCVATVTDAEGQGLVGPPVVGNETATLLGSLERQRATFAW